jgi:hypothetical protein
VEQRIQMCFYRFDSVSELRFLVLASLLLLWLSISTMRKQFVNILWQMSSLSTIEGRKKERKEETLPLTMFQSSLQSTPFWVLFYWCGGDLSDLLPVLLSESTNCAATVCTAINSLLAWNLLQTITIIESDINVKTSSLRNRWRIWNK